MEKRIKNLRELMGKSGLDAILTFSPENNYYLSGFTGSTGYILVDSTDAYMITDCRYTEQAKDECKGFEILADSNNLIEVITNLVKKIRVQRIGVEGNNLTISKYYELKKALGPTEIISSTAIFEEIRIVKDNDEIEFISKSAEIANVAFNHILGFIKPGISEAQVALELEYYMRRNGARVMSFEPAVVSGVRTSLPHGKYTDKIIEKGDFVTMDFGCIYNRYCSDMTRTIVVGKASNKQREIYEIVLKAQLSAMKAIKEGIIAKDVDKIARDIITENGYGSYFGHALGHGVGLCVHEMPNIGRTGEVMLRKGMVVTNEPGIYIEGFGGVRIEDLVVVDESGCRILTTSTKELQEL